MTICLGLESKVIPFLDCSWSKDSKNVQDFEDWTKIKRVTAQKPRMGQFQKWHKYHRKIDVLKSFYLPQKLLIFHSWTIFWSSINILICLKSKSTEFKGKISKLFDSQLFGIKKASRIVLLLWVFWNWPVLGFGAITLLIFVQSSQSWTFLESLLQGQSKNGITFDSSPRHIVRNGQ